MFVVHIVGQSKTAAERSVAELSAGVAIVCIFVLSAAVAGYSQHTIIYNDIKITFAQARRSEFNVITFFFSEVLTAGEKSLDIPSSLR